jgi:hypothetical protein
MKINNRIIVVVLLLIILNSCIFWQATDNRLVSTVSFPPGSSGGSSMHKRMAVWGSYLYLPLESELYIIDFTNLKKPIINDTISVPDLGNVDIYEGNLYLSSPSGLKIYDIEDAGASLRDTGNTINISLNDYIFNDEFIYNITSITGTSIYLECYQIDNDILNVQVVSDVPAIPDFEIEISSGNVWHHTLSSDFHGPRIIVEDRWLYTIGGNQFIIIDLEYKTLASMLTYSGTGGPRAFEIVDDSAYFLGFDTIDILDMTDKYSPVSRGSVVAMAEQEYIAGSPSAEYLFVGVNYSIWVYKSNGNKIPELIDIFNIRMSMFAEKNWLFHDDLLFICDGAQLGIIITSPYN